MKKCVLCLSILTIKFSGHYYGEQLGLSVLLRDTLIHRLGRSGGEPETLFHDTDLVSTHMLQRLHYLYRNPLDNVAALEAMPLITVAGVSTTMYSINQDHIICQTIL